MIRATVQIARAVASVIYDRAKATAEFNRAIFSSVELGKFVRFLAQYLQDAASTSDDHVLDASKALAESSVVAEFKAIDSTKSIGDQFSVNEISAIEAAKVFQEQSSLTDGERRAVEKALQDAPDVTETQAFAILKALSDAVYATDDVNGAADLDDEQNISFFKITSDLAFATESIDLTAEFVRVFSDSGVLSDDDVLFIGKGLADEGFIDDAQTFSVAVSKSDGGSVLESASLDLYKAVSDASSVSESIAIAMDYVRSLGDSSSALEDLSVAIDKVFADAAGVSDVINILLIFNIGLADSAVINDDQILSSGISTFDVGTTSDNQNSDFLKSISDLPFLTDLADLVATYNRLIGEVALIIDLPSIGIERPLDDISSSEDDAVKLTAKNENDASLVADSGTLRSQDYCEFSYFAEDYVGEFRQFT